MTAAEILDQEFLPLRAKLLEVAATLDRLDRAEGHAADDSRLANVQAALRKLIEADVDHRAEQIQLLFSRPYDPDWPAVLEIEPKGSR